MMVNSVNLPTKHCGWFHEDVNLGWNFGHTLPGVSYASAVSSLGIGRHVRFQGIWPLFITQGVPEHQPRALFGRATAPPHRMWRACIQPRFYVRVALSTRRATRIGFTPFPLLSSDLKEDCISPVVARPSILVRFPFIVSNSHTEPRFGRDVVPLPGDCRLQSHRSVLPKCGG